MKKLLTVAMGAILLCGVAGCGASYDKTVLSGEADKVSFHYVGGYEGSWAATGKNLMTAASVADVAKVSKDVAKVLAKRSIKYLYMADIKVDADAGWDAYYWNGTEKVKVDGKFTVKSTYKYLGKTITVLSHFDMIYEEGDQDIKIKEGPVEAVMEFDKNLNDVEFDESWLAENDMY